MSPNPQFPVDSVTLIKEILNGKLHFLYSEVLLHRCFPIYFTKIFRIIRFLSLSYSHSHLLPILGRSHGVMFEKLL